MADKIPVTIRGKRYPSYSAAARALNVSYHAISQGVRLGFLNRVGLIENMHKGEDIEVTIRGTTYPSIAAAARALDLSPTTVTAAYNRGTLENVGLARHK